MEFFKQLFNRQSLSVGWAVSWRAWLAGAVLQIVFSLPMVLWYAFQRTSATAPATLRQDFETLLQFATPLVLGVLIVVLNRIGKSVLRKRNLPVPTRFIGWSIFWRALALSVGLGLTAWMLILMPVAFWFRIPGVAMVAVFAALAAMFMIALCSYGWATLRVSRTAAPD